VTYQVRFVEDAALPSEVEFAFVRVADATYLFVKESAIDVTTSECPALARAWETWQKAETYATRNGLRGFLERAL
jgi:hypothetical protein